MPGDHPDELFAKALMQMGAVTFEQLEAVRSAQAERQPPVPLGDMLVERNIITPLMRENVEKKLRAQKAGGIRALGPYELKKKLGEGGMGAVYLAEDTQLGRPCAVKVLSKEYSANREFISRFRREALAAGKLNHPNIVLAYTVGEELGIHYYAMEYCEGFPLDRILNAQQALPWQMAAEVVMQVARGLQHAHEHGIIHRDIKPSNVFICHPVGTAEGGESNPFPPGFVAKILDLGLAKSIAAGAESSFLTHTGVTLGTPHYISPEQASGERDIDGRTDIYSLGATFYHLVTGQTPFAGSSAAAVILKHMREPLPDPRILKPDIPTGVNMVIQRMLAKRPAERYSTCKEVVDNLQAVLAGQMPQDAEIGGSDTLALVSPNAAAVPVSQRAYPFSMKDRRWLIAGVGGGLVIVVVLVAAMTRRNGSPVSGNPMPARAQVQAQPKVPVVEQPIAVTTRPVTEASPHAVEVPVVKTTDQGAKLSVLEEQLSRERQQAEETRRQLAEAKRQIEEAKRQPEPESQPSQPPVGEPPPDQNLVGRPDDKQPVEPVKPVIARSPPHTPSVPPLHRPENEILSDLERWTQGVLDQDRPFEAPALPDLVWVQDIEGLKRLHLQVNRKMQDAENIQRRAHDNGTAARNRISLLERRVNAPDRTRYPEPPPAPGRTPIRPPPPAPDDRVRREGDAQQLNTLYMQAREAQEQEERAGAALRVLGSAKQATTFRLRKLGVEDLQVDERAPRKEAAYTVYVLQDGRELKASMSVKMGDQITIKDEAGEMHTLNAADIKEIRKPSE